MDETCVIPLTWGMVALVDARDYQWLNQWPWYAQPNRSRKKWYARRTGRGPNRQRVLMHRAILEHHGYVIDGLDADHINGDGLDNRLENLRLVTKAENACNRRKSAGTSQYKGVHWDRGRGKWRASIKVRGVTIQLGRFDSEEEAAMAYNKAALDWFSPHALLNNVKLLATVADC